MTRTQDRLGARLRGVAVRTVSAAANALPEPALRRALVAASHAGRGLPIGPPQVDRALVVAPHPDDESLAMGGLAHRLSSTGTTVTVAWVTDGEGSLAGGTPEELARRRVAEGRRALAHLRVDDVHRIGLPDGDVPAHVDPLAEALDGLLASTRAELVVTTWWGESHPDHRAVSDALARLADRRPDLPVWGAEMWTPVPATNLVDLRPEDVEAKARAVAEHVTAARAFDLTARLALDRYRSVHGLAGRGAAEGYVVTTVAGLVEALARLDGDQGRGR